MPDLQTSVDLCTYCPRLCSHTCPVSLAEARETVTPQAKMSTLGVLRRGTSRGTSSEPLYACTGCGACTDACLHKVSPATSLMEGRDFGEQRGAGHPALADLPRRHREQTQAASAAVQRSVPAESLAKAAPQAYLPACLAHRTKQASDGSGPAREAQTALRVFARVKQGSVPIASLSHLCAGYPLYAGGFFQQFRMYAEVFAHEVKGYGTLILGCPSCTWLLRTQYAAHGVPLAPRVQHVSEFLSPLAPDLPIRRPASGTTYAYHDPCYLGRHLQVFDEPRRLMQRAVETSQEFLFARDAARCSGGGGLLPLTSPRTASAIAGERLAELAPAPGAPPPVVVTACASCERQFNEAGHHQGIRAIGLLELLDRATSP